MPFFWMCVAVMGVVALGALTGRLLQTRCPACGRFFAARVCAVSELASAVTEDATYDLVGNATRNRTTNRGYLVDYRCRRCDHGWQRIRSRSTTVELEQDGRVRQD
jgi:hypothetical protein